MAFGELVGDAYVRIHANTRHMKNAIRRAARDNAEDYAEEFDDRLVAIADQRLKRGREAIAQAIVGRDFDAFQRKFGTVDDTFEHIRSELVSLRNETRLSGKEFTKIIKDLEKWKGAARIKEASDAVVQMVADQDAAERSYRSNLAATVRLERLREKAIKDQIKAYDSYAKNIRFSLEREATPLLRTHANQISLVGTQLDLVNERLARGLGRGSRNNFLNILGSSVGGLAKLVSSFPIQTVGKIGEGIGGLMQEFNVSRMTDNITRFQSFTKVVGPAARAAALGLASFGVAAALVSHILPALVSGFVLLGGAITAVVGAISVGLVGGLLAAAPAFVALGTGLLASLPLFKQLNIEMEKNRSGTKILGDAITALTKQNEENGKSFSRTFAGVFAPLIRDTVLPLYDKMQQATTTLVTHFGTLFNSPQMQKFLDVWEKSLPKAFLSLGRGANNLLAALVAFFTPILPYAERLAENFNLLMSRFRLWAEDAKGQNSIKNFMDVAWKAADSLWGILTNVASILGDIFLSGTKGAGQDFLTYLETITEKFDKWLDTPEGQKAMKQFWIDVRTTMVTVKDIIVEIGKAIDEFDTKQAREDFNNFLTIVRTVAGAIDSVAQAMNTLNTWMSGDQGLGTTAGLLESIGARFNTLLPSPETVLTWATEFGTAVNEALTGLGEIVNTALSDVWEALTKPFRDAWNSLFGASIVPDIVNAVPRYLSQIGPSIVAALSGVANALLSPFRTGATWVSTTVTGLAASVGGWLIGVPGSIASALGSVGSTMLAPFATGVRTAGERLRSLAGSVGGWLSGVPGAIRSALSSVASTMSAPFRDAWSTISGWIDNIAGLFSGIVAGARSTAATVRNLVPGMASGGVLTGPTHILAGESGPEAIVPLRRPLSQVDPAVRELSAFAQGKPTMARGGVAGGGRSITISPGAIVVNSPLSDPALVAEAVFDRIVQFG